MVVAAAEATEEIADETIEATELAALLAAEVAEVTAVELRGVVLATEVDPETVDDPETVVVTAEVTTPEVTAVELRQLAETPAWMVNGEEYAMVPVASVIFNVR